MSDSCRDLQELIHLRDDGELSADEVARVDRHLAECASCRALLDEVRSLRRSLSLLGREEPPEGFRDRTLARLERGPAARWAGWTRWTPALAAAAIVLVTGWYLGLPRGTPGPTGHLVAEKELLADADLEQEEPLAIRATSPQPGTEGAPPATPASERLVGGSKGGLRPSGPGASGPGAAGTVPTGPGAPGPGAVAPKEDAGAAFAQKKSTDRSDLAERAAGLLDQAPPLEAKDGAPVADTREDVPEWRFDLPADQLASLLDSLSQVPAPAGGGRGAPAAGGGGALTKDQGRGRRAARKDSAEGSRQEDEYQGSAMETKSGKLQEPTAGMEWKALSARVSEIVGETATLRLALAGAEVDPTARPAAAFRLRAGGAKAEARDAAKEDVVEEADAAVELLRRALEVAQREQGERPRVRLRLSPMLREADRDDGVRGYAGGWVPLRTQEGASAVWLLTVEFLPPVAPDEEAPPPATGDGG